jgi:hypothetical protein
MPLGVDASWRSRMSLSRFFAVPDPQSQFAATAQLKVTRRSSGGPIASRRRRVTHALIIDVGQPSDGGTLHAHCRGTLNASPLIAIFCLRRRPL